MGGIRVGRVAAFVRSHVVFVGEAAVADGAGERLFQRVRAHVAREVRLLDERHRALRALDGPDVQVVAGVDAQRAGMVELLAANVALEVSNVHLGW